MSSQPSSEFLREFTASLPAAYLERYQHRGLAQHARLAAGRREEPARLDIEQNRASGQATVYLVADDRPGLLAMTSSALATCALEVIDGELYLRSTPAGQQEAVAIFEVVAEQSVLDDGLVERVRETLLGLLEGRLDPELTPSGERRGSFDTHVRFGEAPDGSLSVLEVETADRSGLLSSLARALFRQQVQIVRSEVRTREGRVLDKFYVVEVDGSPIDGARRLQIQVAVLTAIDTAHVEPPAG